MLEIEIFSDIVCPWCFIGKQRLDKVLQTELGEGVNLRWRPYQLHPNMPVEGVDRQDYLQRRYGPDADLARVPGRIASEAEGEGITLRYERIKRMPNTLRAHRLMELAYTHNCQHDLAQALFQAYFCDGVDVGNPQELVRLAQTCGIPGEAAADYLAGDAGEEEVHRQLERAPDLGVSGVPGYYLANSFLLPGAQTVETMTQIISRVKTKLSARS